MPSDVDEHAIPRRGSAVQIAYYVNRDPETLSAAVMGDDAAGAVDWRSPLAAQRFAEYKDRDFLAAVDRAALADELSEWWPASGPRWDALGVATETGAVVLVEAKANVPEIANGPRCGSGDSGSERGIANRERIARALATTRDHFGVAPEAAAAWLDTHCYQYANRLAHLCFCERLGVPALLAHVYFTGDSTYLPTTANQFDQQRRSDAQAMGLADVEIAAAKGVYLAAMPDAYERLRAVAG